MRKLLLACVLAAPLAAPVSAMEIDAADLAAFIQTAQPEIAILGEVHDNPAHHLNQAAAVAALAPRALVFEMLTADQAALITPELRADPVALAEAIGWEDAGWPDFALYAPIFEAAPDALIVGAALPREELRNAIAQGAGRYLGADAERFGNDQPYPAELQAQLEAEAMRDHCDALPEAALPGIVAAQRLRDAVFARATIRAKESTGGPVALITGTGHARIDRAVPAMIRKALPGTTLLALGQIEREAGATPEESLPYDLWIATPPTERPDPCAAFR